MRFDSVVFADTARIAALSCFGRLKSERDAGRKALIVVLSDSSGGETISDLGLGTVRTFVDVEAEGNGASLDQRWRERFAVMLRRLNPKRVMAPLGLMGSPLALDYFKTLRAVMSVDKGRDLLFFEERPQCLVPEAVGLQLASRGVRLPPASSLRSPRSYAPFALKMMTGFGVPPIFGTLRERSKLSRSLKPSFKEVADWDPQRALGPKLQPVIDSWKEGDTDDLFALAGQLGEEARLGTRPAFKRRMASHAASAGSRTPIERSWLSLPDASADHDPLSDSC
ncbi:MAG: hypothetical protein ABIR28_08330 [Vicinamibacteria bacterium]